MSSYLPVESVLRALTVLRCVSELGSANLKRIHEMSGLNRPTTVRMLETLMHAGYVYRQTSGGYAVTAHTLALSTGYSHSSAIAYLAAPVLADLQGAIGWPSDVAVLSGTDMITVATSPAAGRFAFNRPAGSRTSVLGSSLGRAYIAFAASEEQQRVLDALSSLPEPWNDLARHPDRAKRAFRTIRRRGYATIDPTATQAYIEKSLSTFGAPVLVNGVSVASMNIIILRDAVDIRTALKKFLPALQGAARGLARSIAASA